MKVDILLCGVGGQGVLSMAAIIGRAAIAEEWFAKQSEVHGMAQRGGGVQAHLRLADRPIASDLIPIGGAHIVLSMEPLEGLRHVHHLAPDGALVSAAEPVINISDYPPLDELHERIRRMPGAILVEAGRLAAEAGDPQTLNTVMVGAASHRLPMSVAALERAVREMFAGKGEAVVTANLSAFRAGRAAAEAAGVAAAS
jgi:indolepyruvate ferredoxin oxidoreductase beta subunit